MSELQIKLINNIIKMTPKLSLEVLEEIEKIMENEINKKLLELENDVILENMDITEKVMFLDILQQTDEEREEAYKTAIPFEEMLKREGLILDDLQN